MFTVFHHPRVSFATPLKPMAGVATAALLIGWAAGVGAQSPNPPVVPPLPSLQSDTVQKNVPPSAQAPAGPQPQAELLGSNPTAPPLPLSHQDVREAQNQLIALGFDPGAADGEAGPANVTAAQQYDLSRGGSGRVAMDSALLARLKADPAPRLTYEQVAARSQSHSQTHSQARTPTPAASQAGSQFGSLGGIVQKLAPLIGAAINSNNNSNNYGNGNYGGGYGYGGNPAPGFYGPGPVYGGYPYGRY